MSKIAEAIIKIDEMIGHTIGPYGEEPECAELRSIKKLLETEPEPTKVTGMEYNCDNCGADCKAIVNSLCRKGLVDECKNLQGEIDRLRDAIERSVKLQSHYAKLLNQYDGGLRKQFSNADEWIQRLEAVDTKGQAGKVNDNA